MRRCLERVCSPLSALTRTMLSFLPASLRTARGACLTTAAVVISYYLVMDCVLYLSLQTSSLSEKPDKDGELWSPFRPLSIKQLMNDHTSHYVLTPTAEYFDEITKFSKVFSFVTPNMISIAHLCLALFIGRLVTTATSLRHWRIAALLYEFRTCLDAFDGVVYRSHSGTKHLYKSNHNTTGYLVDSICDITGGVFLCFGILFFYFRNPPCANKNSVVLPWTPKPSLENGHGPLLKEENGINGNGGNGNGNGSKLSRKLIFWKVFCFGMLLALSGGSWDKTVDQFTSVFMKPMKDAATEVR
jgi:hypothetical protein